MIFSIIIYLGKSWDLLSCFCLTKSPKTQTLQGGQKLISGFLVPWLENMFDIEWAADQVEVLTDHSLILYAV